MASLRRGHTQPDKDPVRYSDNWVVGTVTRKLHGCMIVNHDVFIHKSAYVGAYDTKEWFACLQENDAVEFIAEEHIESKNRWRALYVRDPPVGYRRAGTNPDCRVPYGQPAPPLACMDNMVMMMPQMDNCVPQAFYGPPPPMMMPVPPMYFPPMYVPNMPAPFPPQAAGFPTQPPYHMYPPSPAPMPNPNQTDAAGFSASPPSPYLQPVPAASNLSAASPTRTLCPSPAPMRYVPDKGDVKNTPHEADASGSYSEEDELTSNASLSSHSTDHAPTPRDSRPVSPVVESTIQPSPESEIKDTDVQIFEAFLASGDVNIAKQAYLARPRASADFLTIVLSLILESKYATADNVKKVKQLFLHFFSTNLFDLVHFQVAWIVAAYRLANGHSIDNQATIDLLSHALVHGYLQMDSLRLIVAPLKATHRAVPLVIGAFSNVLAATSQAFLTEKYHASSLRLCDLDEFVSHEELVTCLTASGVEFLAAPMRAIDALNVQASHLTITA